MKRYDNYLAELFFYETIHSFNEEEKELLLLSKQYCINEVMEHRINKQNSNFTLRNCLDIIEMFQGCGEG